MCFLVCGRDAHSPVSCASLKKAAAAGAVVADDDQSEAATQGPAADARLRPPRVRNTAWGGGHAAFVAELRAAGGRGGLGVRDPTRWHAVIRGRRLGEQLAAAAAPLSGRSSRSWTSSMPCPTCSRRRWRAGSSRPAGPVTGSGFAGRGRGRSPRRSVPCKRVRPRWACPSPTKRPRVHVRWWRRR